MTPADGYTLNDIWWATISGAVAGGAVLFEVGKWWQRHVYRRRRSNLRGPG
jgi:hypothetical protein